MADDAAFLRSSNQGFVSLLTEFALGEFGEGAGEAGLVRNATSTGVTAEVPEGLIGVQFGDELAGVRAVKDALGEEGVGQSEARFGRVPGGGIGGEEASKGDHGAGGDEERESVVEGADFELEAGEKFGLAEMSELQEAR